jgi:hypothetical protein
VGDLRHYFESANRRTQAARRFGMEVETLFVDSEGAPLDEQRSRAIFSELEARGWTARGPEGDWELHRDGFTIKPEVGAGNIELITPPRPAVDPRILIDQTVDRLARIYDAAETCGARPVFDGYDGHPGVDNILMCNERDEKWVGVDGAEALKSLCHIASVHLTVDLAGIDEAFELVARANAFARERDWPDSRTTEVWSHYLQTSRVDYDPRRVGPAPESFSEYLALLRSFRVVMDSNDDGTLRRTGPDPPRLADVESTTDLPLFLGTVWLHTRLRVLNDQLALEVRTLPRRTDDQLVHDAEALLDAL